MNYINQCWCTVWLLYSLLLFFVQKQDYLREQPDNMKSFNIVAETAGFLNLVYSNINPNTIDLVNQLFETVNEFTVVSTLKHIH